MKLNAIRAREGIYSTRAHEAWPAGSRNDRITIKALLILLCSSQINDHDDDDEYDAIACCAAAVPLSLCCV
jgi:hypothetical protein